MRDGVLASLGVSVEDKEGGSVVKLVGVGVMKGVVEEKMQVRGWGVGKGEGCGLGMGGRGGVRR